MVCPVGVRGNVRTLKGRRKVARFLNSLASKNQTRKIRSVLNGYTLKHRKKIIHLKVNGRPLLLEATLMGNQKLVNYLLEECGANVDQTGCCEMGMCTSLRLADSRNFDHVVASLLEHDANFNFYSSSQTTDVSIGYRSLKMMEHLVREGAYMSTLDRKGRTYLMHSVHSAKICQFLLSNGAQVNQTDYNGQDALHFAIRKGKLESVKVLIKNGADILSVGQNQNTPVELSAIECKPALVEYLLDTNCYTNESRPNAYELLGSKILAVNSTKAKFYWAKALQIRNQFNIFPKSVPEHRDHQSMEIPLGNEFQTLDELNRVSMDRESMWTQALLIQSRILGPKHPHAINSFSEKFRHHVSHSEFQQGMSLLKCLFLFYATHLDPLPVRLLLMVQTLRVEAIILRLTENYNIEHVLNLTSLITYHLTTVSMDFVDSLNPTDRQQKLTEVEMYLIEILSQLDYILSFDLTEDQDSRLNVTLYNLIRRQSQVSPRIGLLHLTISLKLSSKLLSRFILCGANIDRQDEFGNTAVHYAIHRHLSDQQPDTLRCLLDHGCQVDITNIPGYCPLEYLRRNGFVRNP